ncbi:CPBP family intramembrane glutamic endopeptidase [Agaribacter flavus]|uniref:CPBP family intramembrane glutamic endopeptidase n=1 Tax=Agaribacter flavus TaxID=1902781 RepID=A0ABV7FSB5_9ALTE
MLIGDIGGLAYSIESIYAYILLFIALPLLEEIVFREKIYTALNKKLNKLSSILILNTIWTVFHIGLSIKALIPLFFVGLFLYHLRNKHNLITAICAHILLKTVFIY